MLLSCTRERTLSTDILYHNAILALFNCLISSITALNKSNTEERKFDLKFSNCMGEGQ